MKLVGYSIDNFKSVRHGDFDVTDISVIIGKNNSGKSNITESLKVFSDKMQSERRGFDSELDQDWFERCITGGNTDEEITWGLTFEPSNTEKEQIRSQVNFSGVHANVDTVDVLSDEDFSKFRVDLTADGRRTTAVEYMTLFDGRMRPLSDIRSQTLRVNRRNVSVHVGNLDISSRIINSVSKWEFVDPIREPEDIADPSGSRMLDERGTELVKVLNYLDMNEPDLFNEIRDSFIDIMDGISNMRARYDDGHGASGKITVMTDEDEFGTRFKFSEVSSGSKDILTLITKAYLSRENTSLLAIEEPELHLHPEAEREVFNILRDTFERYGTQIIISTHSEVFVNEVEVEDVVRTERDGETTIRHIEKGRVENELADLGYNQSEILQAEGVVFVEGRSDRMILPELCKTAGLDLRKEGIEVVELEGEGNTRRNARSLVKVLFSFDIPYLFIIDSHGDDPDDVETMYLDLVNRTDENGNETDPDTIWWHTEPRHFHIWDGYGIESYLLHPDAIASALNVSTDEVETELQEAEDSHEGNEEDKGEILKYIFQELRSEAMDTEATYSKEQDGRAIATHMDEEHLSEEVEDVIQTIRSLPSERPQDHS